MDNRVRYCLSTQCNSTSNQQHKYILINSNMHGTWKLNKQFKSSTVYLQNCEKLVTSKWITAVNTAHHIPPCSDLLHLPLFSTYSPKITFLVSSLSTFQTSPSLFSMASHFLNNTFPYPTLIQANLKNRRNVMSLFFQLTSKFQPLYHFVKVPQLKLERSECEEWCLFSHVAYNSDKTALHTHCSWLFLSHLSVETQLLIPLKVTIDMPRGCKHRSSVNLKPYTKSK